MKGAVDFELVPNCENCKMFRFNRRRLNQQKDVEDLEGGKEIHAHAVI